MSSSRLDHHLITVYAAAARNVHYHNIASLTLLVWNSFVTLDGEIQYIWTMRNKSKFKWVYFFLRYVVILAHVAHNFLIEGLADGNNPPKLCSVWFTYVIIFPQTLATVLEVVLASRVFALYNRSRKVASLLLILILMEVAGSARMLWLRKTTNFHGTCLLIQLNRDAMDQTILAFVVHCILISLTMFKYFFALRAGWGRTPLVSLVVRDVSTVYATVIFLLVSVVVICGLENDQGIAVVFWTTSLMSISGCRMILSMEHFARKEVSIESPPGRPLFTSEFSIRTFDSGNHQHDSSVAPPLSLRSIGNISIS